jgi:2-polyprenyl-6-methoxyphenol hydroxylase-like FAD-dependent oxidoreductase
VRTAIVGAGPTGIFIAISLARRGHEVVMVDRDPGPVASDSLWQRKGVMQFHHAHSFRGQVLDALQAEMPEVVGQLTATGAVVASTPDHPHGVAALLCRRMVFERVLRQCADAQRGVSIVSGHVDRIVTDDGRAAGVQVGRGVITANVVIDASGRASRVTSALRPPALGGPCGAAYVTRQYRLRPDAGAGPVNAPVGLSLSYPGYQAIVFLHDSGTFSVTLVHDGTDSLRELREVTAFEAATRAIPSLREWTHPDRSSPITPVLPGGRLYNTYRGQLDDSGRPALPGMISVGDAVCTTTPLAGRGIAMSFMQACELLRLLDEHGHDFDTTTTAFDHWCAENIKPWFDDHEYSDSERLRRWAGEDVDLSRPLPSDLIVAAAAADPALEPMVGPYMTMDALPNFLAPAESRAKAVYAGGWRPAVPPGPEKNELAKLCSKPTADRLLCGL